MENQFQPRGDCGGSPLGYRGFFPVWIIPIGVGLMMGMAMRRRFFGMGHHQHGWGNGVPPMFMEWHRRAHESQPPAPTETA